MACLLPSFLLIVRLPLGSSAESIDVDIDLLDVTGGAVSVAKSVADALAVPGLPVIFDILEVILDKAKVCISSRCCSGLGQSTWIRTFMVPIERSVQQGRPGGPVLGDQGDIGGHHGDSGGHQVQG